MDEDQTPRIGSVCKDGGRCHHRCEPSGGCSRERCCSPLSCSNLDMQWRTPEEAARDEAIALTGASGSAKSQAGRLGL